MKRLLTQSLVQVDQRIYLTVLIIIAPLLNFLSGISIDLYAPSLPSIADYYQVSVMLVKNTITATMLGFAVGCIIFGALIDIIGRRRVILFGLSVFVLASMAALLCHTIEQLMVVRFVQGMVISTVSIGSRALVVDNFQGKRFAVAILYTSVAYGSGPVIAPFIGGLLQYHFGWKANFVAYTLFGLTLLALFFALVSESLEKPQPFSLQHTLQQYKKILSHLPFIAGVIIMGGVLIEQMIYPTLAPFIVENVLHHSAIAYGNTALLAGCSYLAGTLTNRLVVHRMSQKHLTYCGFVLLFMGVVVQYGCALWLPLNLITLVVPIMLIGYSLGFIFPNVLGACLKLFPSNVGVASAVQSCALMLIGAMGVFTISHFSIVTLMALAPLYSCVAVVQLLVFMLIFRKIM